MSRYHLNTEKVVKLNVGGTFYSSTKETLTKVHGSYIGRIFTGDAPCPRDDQGSYFIDRDGPMFRSGGFEMVGHILNYLRSDRLSVPYGFREFALLKVEADFYGLQALVQEIEVILVSFERKRRRRPNPNRKKTSQSVKELHDLHRVHERDGDLYISDEDSDWFYD